MLNLASATQEAWFDVVVKSIDELLLDHAHCEKKAASTIMNVLHRYGTRPELFRPLSQVAREELEHFEIVLDLLERRHIAFRPLQPSSYAGRLHQTLRSKDPERLLDTLLVSSLIEARSCERMKILSERLEDPELADMYRRLLASEARHHHLYVELAKNWFSWDVIHKRLQELATIEADILAEPPTLSRMHA